MTATDEMLGIVPVVVTAGVVTRLADTMFPKNGAKTRTVTKTKYVTRKAKKKTAKKSVRKTKGNWKKGYKKSIQEYL